MASEQGRLWRRRRRSLAGRFALRGGRRLDGVSQFHHAAREAPPFWRAWIGRSAAGPSVGVALPEQDRHNVDNCSSSIRPRRGGGAPKVSAAADDLEAPRRANCPPLVTSSSPAPRTLSRRVHRQRAVVAQRWARAVGPKPPKRRDLIERAPSHQQCINMGDEIIKAEIGGAAAEALKPANLPMPIGDQPIGQTRRGRRAARALRSWRG